jgi:Uma2 family endonuclease
MTTAERVMLGPADHGRRMNLDEFHAADRVSGWHPELVDGRVWMSPRPEPAEAMVGTWLLEKFARYRDERRDVIDFVWSTCAIYFPSRPDTVLLPDLTAYPPFNDGLQFHERQYEDISPLLVAEVMTEETRERDLVRNPEMFLQIPSIREYWVFDISRRCRNMTLSARRRSSSGWRIEEVRGGEAYTTPHLPGLRFTMDFNLGRRTKCGKPHRGP